ncbi:T9SS type B sorting domain-containing protein [Flavobacterium sp.]|uniref:T9SS type B sorting domain-containing protein n=1 Tax=Flavobacterium sp. TaxID=239 RepID=UPI0026177961|nr:T9SS type B sorting domain-containing protein [Flavobacterium sp.]
MNIFYKALVPIFLLLSFVAFGQGGASSCAALQADFQQYQSCATSIPFTNSTNNPSGENFTTSCIEEPFQGPTWFFIKVKISGTIQLEISQVSNNGTGTDVDFVLWGPFADLNSVCGQLNTPNEIDCSWSAAATEQVTLPNGVAGQLYVLLVDNYSNVPGQITITQTGGNGSSDCGFLSAVDILDSLGNEITNTNYCIPDTKELVATADTSDFTGDLANYRYNFKWYKDAVLISTVTNSTSSTNTITVNQTGVYSVDMTAYDSTDTTVDPNTLEVSSDDISLTFVDAPDITLQSTATCLGDSPLLTAIDNNANVQLYSYQWFRNNNAIPGATAGSFSPAMPGAYFVEVSNSICTPVNSNTIAIYATPIVQADPGSAICEGDSYDIGVDVANISDLTAVQYQWFKDGVLMPGVDTNHLVVSAANQTPNTTAQYQVQVTEQGSCSALSNNAVVTVNARPQLNPTPVTLEQCDYIAPNNDGVAVTNLTQAYNALTNNNTQYVLSYFVDPGLTQAVNNPAAFVNSTPNQTIYVTGIIPNQNQGCTSNTATISLIVNPTAVASYTNMAPVCPELNSNFGYLDFDAQRQVIKNTFFPTNNVSIDFYANENDASVEQNALTNTSQLPIGTAVIYSRVEMGNNCFEVGTFSTQIYTPPVQTLIPDESICASETIVLSSKDAAALAGQNNAVQVSYFHSFDEAKDNVNVIPKNSAVSLPVGDNAIFARLVDNNSQCLSIVDFNISVFANPILVQPSAISLCGDATAVFNLNSRIPQITAGNPNYQVTFYETPQDLANGNAIATPDAYESAPKTIFIKAVDPTNNSCASTTSLVLNVFQSPGSTNNPEVIQVCSSDGFAEFDLTKNEQEMAGNTPLNEIEFRYYIDPDDADENNANTISTPEAFTNTTALEQIIYVRLNGSDRIDSETGIACYRILEQQIFARPYPENKLFDYPYKICVDINSSVVNPAVVDAGLPNSDYYFIWYNGFDAVAGNEINGANGNTFTTGTEGEYSVRITNVTNLALCQTVANFTTRNSFVPFSIQGNPTELIAFETENTVTAIVTPESDDFEYMIDNTPWQDSNVFTDIPEGIYTLRVRNKYGCGEISTMIAVADYPRFLTPNGDGYNDTWNIGGRIALDRSNVFIFDRFGKLVKEITTNETGWDGTYNGKPMPSDDYWFRINYTAGGQQKEFLGHFTLKR